MQCPLQAIVNPRDEFGRIVNLVDESTELVLEVDDRRKGHTALATPVSCALALPARVH